jgi:hypothetical protein
MTTKKIDRANALGWLLALAMALTLCILVLSTQRVAAQPAGTGDTRSVAQATQKTTSAQGDTTVPMTVTAETPRPVAPFPWVQIVTTTAPLPPLPGWLVELQDRGEKVPAANEVVISKSAPKEVIQGDVLDYTLIVSNSSDYAATVLVHDVLPIQVREGDIQCSPDCAKDVEVVTVEVIMPTQYGAQPYTETITTVHRVNWPNVPLAPHESRTMQVSMRVTGQTDGTVLTNRAYIRYTLDNGSGGTAISNETQTLVQVSVAPGAGFSLSAYPNRFFEDYGGTASLDWGDYDRDGYPDLLLGSSGGTIVFRDEQGHLARFWNSYLFTTDVHWADFNGDGLLEIVAIGYNRWTGEVSNRIYRRSADGSRFMDAGLISFASQPLLRVVPYDYDADGDLDLVAVTYRQWTQDGCTVRAYPNDGGQFTAPYRCLVDPYRDYGKRTEDLLSLGDIDNDDDLDLVLDLYDQENPHPPPTYRDLLWILPNSGGSFTATGPITVGVFTEGNWPIDVAWGDYDGDGDLDLAAAVPVLSGAANHEVIIYRNGWVEGERGSSQFTPAVTLEFPHSTSPFPIAWGDFDADGDLDLAAGGPPLRIYLNSHGSFSPDRFVSIPVGAVQVPAADLAAADEDNDGDLDLAVANPFGNSALYTTFAALLNPGLSRIASWSANSVAWGDADGDGGLDLLFGAGESTVDAELYFNEEGAFANHSPFPASGFGPHSVAFGDVNGDGALDVALGTTAGTQVYLAGHRNVADWTSPPDFFGSSLAWADADNDGDLDLLAGTDGPTMLYRNLGTQLSPTASWVSAETDDTRSVAWGDYDHDRYLDFAVGNYDGPTRVYRNNRDGSFGLAWSSSTISHTTSIAWADYDGDGDLDLTVGNYGQANLIYKNSGGALGEAPVWHSEELSKTTSLAWGDWDNDGDLDLAVGNDGERVQVYLNRGSRPGSPQLLWLWSSAQAYPTTGVAWGDRDGDGDLDLAISSSSQIGFFENNYVRPSHLADNFVPTLWLPNQPAYLSIGRPGNTADADFYSSAELLSGPEHPTVTIQYTLFDPDGTRRTPGSNEPGDPIAHTFFQFSLDGGGTWHSATPLAASPPPATTTRRLGQEATFVWNAVADQAISDNARFRIGIVHQNRTGPVQRASTWTTSPPFRVRGTTCFWPTHPSIIVSSAHPEVNEAVHFTGAVDEGHGVLTFLWNFGDGRTAQWQEGSHTYTTNGTYVVRLTVRSEPCPIVQEVLTSTVIVAGTGVPNVYLPIVMKKP